jgi:hypothetical protein
MALSFAPSGSCWNVHHISLVHITGVARRRSERCGQEAPHRILLSSCQPRAMNCCETSQSEPSSLSRTPEIGMRPVTRRRTRLPRPIPKFAADGAHGSGPAISRRAEPSRIERTPRPIRQAAEVGRGGRDLIGYEEHFSQSERWATRFRYATRFPQGCLGAPRDSTRAGDPQRAAHAA